jgi:acetate kinase
VELGGLDVLVFTGGIGENSSTIRTLVCENLEGLGIALDADRNARAKGECQVGQDDSPAQIWTIPTNEELVVARQARQLLEG